VIHSHNFDHTEHETSFSKEVESSQCWITTALPTDFEFQHSCNEDDNMAEKNLSAGMFSDNDNMIQVYIICFSGVC